MIPSASSGIERRGALALGLLLAGALALQLAYGFLDRAPDYDEAFYLDLARGITRTGLPQPRPESPVFLAHPPLFYYLESLLFLGGEPPLPVARSLSTLLSLLTLWTLYRLMRRVWGPPRALTAVGLLAVNPCFIYYSHSVYMESTVTFFALWGLERWLADASAEGQAGGNGSAGGATLAGSLLGLSVLAKYLGGLYLLGIAGRCSASLGRKVWTSRRFLALLAGTVVAGILWALYALAVSPHRFFMGLAFWLSPPQTRFSAYSWRMQGLFGFAAYATGVVTPVFLVLFLLGVADAIRGIRKGEAASAARETCWTALSILGVFALFFVLVSNRDVKYLAVALPLLAIFASGPLLRLSRRIRRPLRLPLLVPACLLLVGPFTWLYDPMAAEWRPNLVLFGLQRDGRYVDLMEMGKRIRAERPEGARLVADNKNSLLAYYGDLEALNAWGMPWSQLSKELGRARYFLHCTDAPPLPPRESVLRDRLLAKSFQVMEKRRRGDLLQVLYRRAPGGAGEQGRTPPPQP